MYFRYFQLSEVSNALSAKDAKIKLLSDDLQALEEKHAVLLASLETTKHRADEAVNIITHLGMCVTRFYLPRFSCLPPPSLF